MKRLFHSLYAKISAVFLVVLLVLGVVQILISVNSSLNYVRESDQALNRSLAADLVNVLSPFLKDSLDYASVEHSIHDLMVMNPRVEIYLLDGGGNILAFFADPKKKVKLESVGLEAVHDFLNEQGNMPILGDDPRHVGRLKPFSAARAQIGPEIAGYLYVILGGERYDSAASMIMGSYIIRTSAIGIGVTLIFAAFVGLIIFGFLTKRFHRMTDAVKRFEKGEFDQRISIDSDDEIGRLSGAFNQMADTIVGNMEELQRTDRLRRELIANVSHDLRSPLASIQGYLETIQMKAPKLTDHDRERYLRIIYDNTISLSKLVGELFELSKLDANQVQPISEVFSMAELTQDVVMKFQPQAENLAVNLKVSLPRDLPMVDGDIGLLERALSNLIDNALSYTPEKGTVNVNLETVDDKVCVEVVDTGYGISPEEIPRVFERFHRVEKSRTRKLGGTGLGLAIAKRILELHDSSISIQSVVDQGTTFSFNLQGVH